MAHAQYTILKAQDRWWIATGQSGIPCREVGPVDVDPVNPATTAESIATALRLAGWRGQGVCLALPVREFYWASIATTGLAHRGLPTGMLYRLEEQLPVDAEALAAAFVRHNGSALGLAIVVDSIQPLLAQLEAQGITIELLAPRTWLALQAIQAEHAQNPPSAALLAADDHVELWILSEAGPTVGDWLDGDGPQCARSLGAAELLGWANGQSQLAVDGALLPETQAAARENWPGTIVPLENTDLNQLASQTAADHLAGRSAAWVNLRQGRLTPAHRLRQLQRPLRIAAGLLLAILVASSAGLLWRAHDYDQAALAAQQDLEQTYAALHRGQPVPPSVKQRLLSEWRVASGLKGVSRELPRQVSALDSLYEILRPLPAQMRLRILEVRVDGDSIYLEGQARSHADAEALAAALRKAGTLEIAAPKSEQIPAGGVSFVLTGKPIVGKPAPAVAEKPAAPTTRGVKP